MAGALSIPLNVTQTSHVSGAVTVNGPFKVWVLLSVWSCVLTSELSGVPLPCPPPYDPPPFPTWNETYSSTGTFNVSAFQLNATTPSGVLPPANWLMVIIDGESVDEVATITSSVVLSNP